MVRAKVMVGLG